MAVGLCSYFCFLFYFGYFKVALLIFIFFAVAHLKKTYVDKQQNQEKKTAFAIILTDLETVEYHFNKEFKLFNYVRKFNIILLFFIIYNFYLFTTITNQPDYLYSYYEISSMEKLYATAVQNLFVVWVFNTFLICSINWIIVDYCNKPVEWLLAQKCLLCFTAFGSTGTFGLGCHLYFPDHPS
jgi:hypothetical protein